MQDKASQELLVFFFFQVHRGAKKTTFEKVYLTLLSIQNPQLLTKKGLSVTFSNHATVITSISKALKNMSEDRASVESYGY